MDSQQETDVSSALWVPLLWYAICATRPVGVWLENVGIVSSSSDLSDLSGSLIDRFVFSLLTVLGIYILSKRQVNWLIMRRCNVWLYLFVLYMLISLLWSDYPAVSFKRFTKIFGSLVMAMILITESNPLESFLTILRRCFFVHLPWSIIFIKYFRNLGVSWDYMGKEESWIGLATSKNVLGQVVMLSGIVFLLRIKQNWGKKIVCIDFIYFAMSLYLLKGSKDSLSATSLAVFLLGVMIVFVLPAMKHSINSIKLFALSIGMIILVPIYLAIQNSVRMSVKGSIFGGIFSSLGRDMTFTGRTEFWSEILDVASANPFFGVGYGAFWIGRTVNVPFSDRMTSWYLGQAHNGYIDLYLQLGFVGLFLFILVICFGYKNIINIFPANFEFARIKMALLSMILLLNVTESTMIRGDHHLWFISLFAMLYYPINAKLNE